MFLLLKRPWVTCRFRSIQVIVACWPVVWHPIATSAPKSAKPKPSKPNWNHIFEFLWLLVFSYRSPSSSHLLVNPKFLSDLLGIGSMGTFPAVWSQDGCHGGRHLDLGTWFHPSQTSASVMSEISERNPLKRKGNIYNYMYYIYIFTRWFYIVVQKVSVVFLFGDVCSLNMYDK